MNQTKHIPLHAVWKFLIQNQTHSESPRTFKNHWFHKAQTISHRLFKLIPWFPSIVILLFPVRLSALLSCLRHLLCCQMSHNYGLFSLSWKPKLLRARQFLLIIAPGLFTEYQNEIKSCLNIGKPGLSTVYQYLSKPLLQTLLD